MSTHESRRSTIVTLTDNAYLHLIDLTARYGWSNKTTTLLRGFSDLLNHLANPRISYPHDWLDTRPEYLRQLDSMNHDDYVTYHQGTGLPQAFDDQFGRIRHMVAIHPNRTPATWAYLLQVSELTNTYDFKTRSRNFALTNENTRISAVLEAIGQGCLTLAPHVNPYRPTPLGKPRDATTRHPNQPRKPRERKPAPLVDVGGGPMSPAKGWRWLQDN